MEKEHLYEEKALQILSLAKIKHKLQQVCIGDAYLLWILNFHYLIIYIIYNIHALQGFFRRERKSDIPSTDLRGKVL